MTTSSSTSGSGAGCLMLFAMPFAIVGLSMSGCGSWTAFKHYQSRDWVAVPATITSAELKRGDTTQTLATYTYDYEGRQHTGDRVSLYFGGDSLDDFHRSAFNKLDRHRRTRRPFRTFVNPDRPEESVLYRDVRWKLLLMFSGVGALFGSAGFGLATAAAFARRQPPPSTRTEQSAAEPWNARSDWAAGRIGPSTSARATAPTIAVVAGWWWISSLPLLALLPQILDNPESPWVWTTLALPAIGAFITFLAVKAIARRRKFGESVFEMTAVPGVVGGALSGVVRIPARLNPASGFRVRLICLNQSTDDDGNKKHERVAWEEEQLVTRTLDRGASGETAVPVLFAIPNTARSTTGTDALPRIRWLLEIGAQLPGVDYKTEFEVPVFRTGESREDFALDPRLVADYAAPPDPEVVLREARIRKQPLGSGNVRIVFPAARNINSAIVMTIIAALMCGGAWLMYVNGLPIVFPLVLGPLGLLFAWVAVGLWLYRSVVEASRRGLRVRGGWLSVGRTHFIPAEEVGQFTTKMSMATERTVWCNIGVTTTDGKKHTIGRGVRSKLAQKVIVDVLSTALGREHEAPVHLPSLSERRGEK